MLRDHIDCVDNFNNYLIISKLYIKSFVRKSLKKKIQASILVIHPPINTAINNKNKSLNSLII
jgi:hypothetical protein